MPRHRRPSSDIEVPVTRQHDYTGFHMSVIDVYPNSGQHPRCGRRAPADLVRRWLRDSRKIKHPNRVSWRWVHPCWRTRYGIVQLPQRAVH
jgi:hypothetical protein